MERAKGANHFQILSKPLLTFFWRVLFECNFRPIQSLHSRRIFQFIAFTRELANVLNQFLFVSTAPTCYDASKRTLELERCIRIVLQFAYSPSLPLSSASEPSNS